MDTELNPLVAIPLVILLLVVLTYATGESVNVLVDNAEARSQEEDYTCDQPAHLGMRYISYALSNKEDVLKIRGVDYINQLEYGYSMFPILMPKTTYIAILYEGQELEPCMIVKFNIKDTQWVHVVETVYEDYIITKGLNNDHYDDKVMKEDITHIIIGVLFT